MTATRVLCSLAGLLVAAPALAQAPPRDPIAAEALFERGKELVDQGHVPEACAAFAESQRLDPAGGTLLRLALCHEAEGKLASAWVEYLEVERASLEGTGETGKLAERVRIAREHLGAIGSRVPKLVIVVPAATRAEGMRITANGLPRNESAWGLALPVDPGDVTVVATARGHRESRTVVRMVEGQQVTVELSPLPLEPMPAPASGASTSQHASLTRPLGIGLGLAGLAVIGVGTFFGARAISKWNASNDVCPGTACPTSDGVTLAGDARDSARAADVSLAIGAAAVVAGVILYVAGAPPRASMRGTGDSFAVSF